MAKYKKIANPDFAKAMREIGRSSATEPHADRRTRRARSRFDAKKRAIESDGN